MFYVGDEVFVRANLDMTPNTVGVNGHMRTLEGKKVTIANVEMYVATETQSAIVRYRIVEDNGYWKWEDCFFAPTKIVQKTFDELYLEKLTELEDVALS